MPRTAVTQQHTHKIVTSQLVVLLLFVKREVHRCDCLQFLVHFYSRVLFYLEVLILISVVNTFCWDLYRAILVTSCIILLFCATNLCLLFWCD